MVCCISPLPQSLMKLKEEEDTITVDWVLFRFKQILLLLILV